MSERRSGFELSLCVVEGGFEHDGPMTQSRSYYVEVSIDGTTNTDDKTDLVKIRNGKIVWNKQIIKTFKQLETPTPTIIALTMYKKKFIHSGIRLIGTAHINLTDLIRIIDKPAVRGKISLNMSKCSISGPSYLLLELQVRNLNSNISTAEMKSIPITTSTIIPFFTMMKLSSTKSFQNMKIDEKKAEEKKESSVRNLDYTNVSIIIVIIMAVLVALYFQYF